MNFAAAGVGDTIAGVLGGLWVDADGYIRARPRFGSLGYGDASMVAARVDGCLEYVT